MSENNSSEKSTREQFEHWMIVDAPRFGRTNPLRKINGEYAVKSTEIAFAAWNASAGVIPKSTPAVERWPKFADGERGCPKCGAYADPVTGEVKHENKYEH